MGVNTNGMLCCFVFAIALFIAGLKGFLNLLEIEVLIGICCFRQAYSPCQATSLCLNVDFSCSFFFAV